MISNRDEAADQRDDAQRAEIDRPDLRVADLAQPVGEPRRAAGARRSSPADGMPGSGGATDLNAGEDVLIFGHVHVLPLSDQIGRSSHQFHHSGQPSVQNGPLMMMQTALQKPASSARNRPRRWMPSVPIE